MGRLPKLLNFLKITDKAVKIFVEQTAIGVFRKIGRSRQYRLVMKGTVLDQEDLEDLLAHMKKINKGIVKFKQWRDSSNKSGKVPGS